MSGCTKDLMKHLSQFRYVIWDWNGTILNDAEMVCHVNNLLLDEHELPRITIEDYRHRFAHPVVDYYEGLGFDFNKTSFQEIGDRFIELYAENMKDVKAFPKIHALIENLHGELGQSILSAAHQPKLRNWVGDLGLSHFFEHIFGIEDHYAHGKIHRGKELLELLNVESSHVVIIGDTDHDVEVAEELGVSVVLIANGHQSSQRLEKVCKNVFEISE